MKKIFNKKIMISLFVFGLFLANTNNSNAQVYVTTNQYNYIIPSTIAGPEINNLPLCDSTYKLNCPFNVRCRNINGMIAFACPASYANQPVNNYYSNNDHNNSYYNNHNYNNNNNYNNTYQIHSTNYKFVNSPVYYENGAYYTNPVIRPSYDIAPTYNQANYYSY